VLFIQELKNFGATKEIFSNLSDEVSVSGF
jgi:hypothetical protein